jgi:membrane peptidoglycan carboxypeptidase
MVEPRRPLNPDLPREGRARGIVKWALVTLIALLVVAIAAGGIFWVGTPIPNPNKDFVTANTHLLYGDGKTELGTLSVQNREALTIDQIPQNMRDAMVAAENPTFWTDPGVSIPALARAIISLGSKDSSGGSTITQQYVKILYLTSEKTLTRKLKEMVIAVKLGQEQTKEQILEGYLNTVYFGRGAYGIEAASQAFFGIPAAKVNQQQAIVLASLVNAPGLLDPALGDKQAKDLLERYQYVINSLVKMGKMTEADKAKIYTALPEFPTIKKDPRFGGTDGYLMKVVIDELKKDGFDEATINGGGLEVVTTFDKARQDAAVAVAQAKTQEAAAEKGQDAAKLHASIVSIDNATGGVLAMYGGNPDYVTGKRNWATQARATGSTFKTWALVAALRQGIPLDKELKGYTFTAADGQPVTGETNGMVTLADATTHSINAAYVDLTTQLKDGGANAIKAANDAGIPGAAPNNGWDADIRVAMGTAEVSPLDNAAGYSTLANDGLRVPTHVVKQVTDRAGKVVYTADTAGVQAIEPSIAQGATACLTEVATSGTGRVVSALGYPVAGKTGTRWDGQKTTSSWFVGYTKQITTAVNYVAGDTGNENLDDYSTGFYGAGYPAGTWLAFMQKAMKGLPAVDFTKSTYTPSVTTTRPAPVTTTRTPTQAPTQTAQPTVTVQPTQAPTKPAPPQPTQPATTTKATTTTTTTPPGNPTPPGQAPSP